MERRQYERFAVPCIPVRIKPVVPDSAQPIRGVMGNISYGGLQLFCNQFLGNGEYQIQFTLPNSGTSEIKARLCYSFPKMTVHGLYVAGFQYLELSAIEFTKIKVFCSGSALLKAANTL